MASDFRQPSQSSRSTSSGGGYGLVLAFVGFILLALPIGLPTAGYNVPVASTGVLFVAGAVIFVFGLLLMFIPRVFHKATADMALVRSGWGGAVAAISGGLVVFPMIHTLTRVSLLQHMIEITREGAQALRTRNRLKVNIKAEFLVTVPSITNQVITAATRLGEKTLDAHELHGSVEKIFDSALRQVATEMDLDELIANRPQFIENVSGHIRGDLEKMGLELLTVTISALDQTPATDYDENNVLDAEARLHVTRITQKALRDRTEIELQTTQEVAALRTKTAQVEAQQAIDVATAEADRDQQIKVVRAERQRDAAIRAAELDQETGLARVQSEQEVQLAETRKAQALDVATQQREAAARAAEIAKNRDIEVAEKQREIAVAEQEQALAVAEAQRLLAAAQQEDAAQQVQTVTAKASAERAAQAKTIEVEALAKQDLTRRQQDAEAAAFATEREAQAEQTAAAARAAATTTQARAEREAAVARAEGRAAEEYIPVQVKQKEVEVEQARIAVNRAQLEVDIDRMKAQTDNSDALQKLELGRAQIDAERDVRVAQAQAMGQALSGANMRFFGDAQDMERVFGGFVRGQAISTTAEGLLDALPDEVRALLPGIGAMIVEHLNGRNGHNGHTGGERSEQAGESTTVSTA